MPESELRLVRRFAEFRPKDQVPRLPHDLRGLYVLYHQRRRRSRRGRRGCGEAYDVVYVGLAGSGIRGRLMAHARSKRKADLWTHFSAFQVWDNIRTDEIAELEGLFRLIYRKDSAANALNRQKKFAKASRVRENDLARWQDGGAQ